MNDCEEIECKPDDDIVPIPDKRRGAKPVFYPFDNMEINHSFTVNRAANTMAYAIRRYRESGHDDRRFVIRALPDGRTRVWRVA
jgi:hypothetical protein